MRIGLLLKRRGENKPKIGFQAGKKGDLQRCNHLILSHLRVIQGFGLCKSAKSVYICALEKEP